MIINHKESMIDNLEKCARYHKRTKCINVRPLYGIVEKMLNSKREIHAAMKKQSKTLPRGDKDIRVLYKVKYEVLIRKIEE